MPEMTSMQVEANQTFQFGQNILDNELRNDRSMAYFGLNASLYTFHLISSNDKIYTCRHFNAGSLFLHMLSDFCTHYEYQIIERLTMLLTCVLLILERCTCPIRYLKLKNYSNQIY
jgi:hypothetical protein